MNINVNGVCGRFLGANKDDKNGLVNIVTLPYSATFDTAFMPKAMFLSDEKTEKVFNFIIGGRGIGKTYRSK